MGPVRPAAPADLAALLALDPQADPVGTRAALEGAGDRRVLVLGAPVAAYAVVGRFFGHDLLERLWVGPDQRRRGCASALLDQVEADLAGDRLFVSTNESNTPMRTLLTGRGYRVSGMIEDLDPDDPELFFVIYRTFLDARLAGAS